MEDILKNLYNDCDPLKPAQPKFYTDLSMVRGGETFIKTLCEELERSTGNVCVLFTGHSGCGKSSELQKLTHELRTVREKPSHNRYFPVYIDALEYIDVFDASLQEILLSIVSELAAAVLKEEGIELKNTVLQSMFNEIAGYVTGSKPTKLTLPFGEAKLEIALNRADPSIREQVRQYLKPRTSSLVTEINNVLIDARTQLKAKMPRDGGPIYRDIVIVVDNLEKIQTLAGHEIGENSAHALFIEGAPQLSTLKAHVIYTVHLSLARANGHELLIAYGKEPVVLSNVKTEERTSHAPWQPGREALRELLEKRIHPLRLEQVFDTDSLEFILTYCGGHTRQYLNFVREATLYTDTTPISLQAAQRAVTQAVPFFSTEMDDSDWKLLAELEHNGKQRWNTKTPERRLLMDRLCVLEYINGDRAQDMFNKAMPWYAVHPIARELDPFREALDALQQVETS